MQEKSKIQYLKGILLVHPFDWRCESSELVGDRLDVVNGVRTMARTVGVLGGVDETKNCSARG